MCIIGWAITLPDNVSGQGFPYQDPDLPVDARVNDLVSRMTLQEKISQMQNGAVAVPRLGIPEYDWWNECLHGVARNGVATVFPQAIGMAATWDPELIGAEAEIISTEARAKYNEAVLNGERNRYQGLTMWSPNINIFRDPRWGRGQETYGEDPYLTSRIGVAFVKGLQGDDPYYFKVVSTPKHFAVHSGPEPLRHSFDVDVSDRDLYETYLPAFKACITEGGAYSVMGAYNRFRGESCSASEFLLDRTLREEWGFEGYVVSDCGAIWDIYNGHHIFETAAEASALAVKMGCDLTCGREYRALYEAVEKGMITEEEIDVSLKRLMTAKMRLGMFDPPARVPYAQIPFSENNTAEHSNFALKVARESMVLLKNENKALPIGKEVRTIAVIGPYADNLDVLLGNYNGDPTDPVTILQGILNRAGEEREVLYAQGVVPPESLLRAESEGGGNLRDEGDAMIAEAVSLAEQSDVAIVVAGISPRLEGEEMRIRMDGFEGGDRTHLKLPGSMQELIRKVYATGKPVVLVLTSGSALAVNWEREHIPAILQAWYPGQQGGNAVADVLFGHYNPAGRLPVTYYRSVDDLPDFENYDMEGRTYKYFRGEPLFSFGHGLSYTDFDYRKIAVSDPEVSANDTVEVTVSLANVGDLDGDEVVQLYVRDLESTQAQPIRALKAFKRIHIESGDESTVVFPLAVMDFAFYDQQKGDFVVEPGVFEIEAGASSADLRLTARIVVE